MKTINMPGFSAQGSLYISRTTASHNYQKHHPNSGLLLQRNVVPQAPIFLGQVCQTCVPIGYRNFGYGAMLQFLL